MAMVADPDGNVIALWEDNVSAPAAGRMSLPRAFASDNTSPAHPAVFDALRAANDGAALPYGDDPWTMRALRRGSSRQFGEDSEAFLVWNGTGANVVALRAHDPPVSRGHLRRAGAHQSRRMRCAGVADRLQADRRRHAGWQAHAGDAAAGSARGGRRTRRRRPAWYRWRNPPNAAPSTRSPRCRALCASARELDLLVHVDGSRIANAAAALDLPLRAFTRDAGVDYPLVRCGEEWLHGGRGGRGVRAGVGAGTQVPPQAVGAAVVQDALPCRADSGARRG